MNDEVVLGPIVEVGVQVPVASLWTGTPYRRTAVLVLDTECQACISNLPFYQEIDTIAAATEDVRFVILTEEPVERTRTWLRQAGVVAATVVKVADRKPMGFLGTPTLMLADSTGVVTDIALGTLGESRADQFKARLRGSEGARPLRLPFSIEERYSGGRSDQELGIGPQLVDTRDEGSFAQKHSRSAINIPDDELRIRAEAELNRSLPVFLDCRHDDQARCRIVAYSLGDIGFATVVVVLP